MRYVDGNVFEGDFKFDNMNGKGVLTYANGDVYTGDYKDDKKHGEGVYAYKSGDKYEGHWVYFNYLPRPSPLAPRPSL